MSQNLKLSHQIIIYQKIFYKILNHLMISLKILSGISQSKYIKVNKNGVIFMFKNIFLEMAHVEAHVYDSNSSKEKGEISE